MMIKRLEWETENFGYPCASIEIDEAPDTSEFRALPSRLIVLRSKNPLSDLAPLLVDEKITYQKDISSFTPPTSGEAISGLPLTDQILKLAFESGKNSRFYRDPHFTSGEFSILYTQWIENSLNKSLADEVFVLGTYEDPVGLITLKAKSTEAAIGLLAIAENVQGRGLGKELLNLCEKYCLEKNIKTLTVPTQVSNRNACKFYERNGFRVQTIEYIYHWWNE